ncbi:MAG: M23 family metallopeptidase [Campylobacterota bacterium]|nr:M23 family metallopeptidase [Campylobacterota bacterium]
MLVRYLLLSLIFFLHVDANEYPQTFSKIGTSLFKSKEAVLNLSDIDNLQKISNSYINSLNTTMAYGFKVDESHSDKEKKKYLLELRNLQKQHDEFLHYVHSSIDISIKDNDYDKFCRLTSYEFDGFLNSRALLSRSIAFYETNNSKQKNSFFDSKIQFKKLLQATNIEFDTKITRSTFNTSEKISSTKKVYMYAKETHKYITIYARNKNPYTITIEVKGKIKKLLSKRVGRTFCIKPDSTQRYIILQKEKNFRSYSFSYSWIKGSMDAIHDDSYIYALPYKKGTSHVVSQGFNGKVTHKGSNRFAVDFPMKTGTKVCASREGVVVDIKEDSTKGGFNKKFSKYGNFITIQHSDETMATYYHLKKNGSHVKLRQKVNRGEHIGYSGNTGYSSGPHLHFQVYKAVNAKKIQSLRIKFLSSKGVVVEPKKGRHYKAK